MKKQLNYIIIYFNSNKIFRATHFFVSIVFLVRRNLLRGLLVSGAKIIIGMSRRPVSSCPLVYPTQIET